MQAAADERRAQGPEDRAPNSASAARQNRAQAAVTVGVEKSAPQLPRTAKAPRARR